MLLFQSMDLFLAYNIEGNQSWQKTEDGFELSWAVNVMAPFLLTSLLLDNITERIVNVSSISAGSSIDFDNLQQVIVASMDLRTFKLWIPFCPSDFNHTKFMTVKLLSI